MNKYPQRKMKKLARLYVASMIKVNSEIHVEDRELQEIANELEPYLREVADELLQKAGEVDTCITFDECAHKVLSLFKFKDEDQSQTPEP